MGFYIRKSVSVGPFRFNLSKSGIGLSAGITGLRLGKGPRGTYIHAGRGGVYYRKTLSPEPSGLLFHSKPSTASQDKRQIPTLDVVDSGPVLRMVDAASIDVLNELNSRTRSHSVWLVAICIVAILGGLYLVRLPWWFSAVVTAVGLLVIVFLQQRNIVRDTVAMLYDLEPEVEKAYSRLHEIFDEIARADGVWHVEALGNTVASSNRPDAVREVQRKRISLKTGLPPNVRSNLEVPMIPVGKQSIYFFPDMLLVYENANFGSVSYGELEVEVKEPRSLEDGKTSSSNVEEIHFRSTSGLNELLQVSRGGNGAKLKSALIDLAKFSNVIKADIG